MCSLYTGDLVGVCNHPGSRNHHKFLHITNDIAPLLKVSILEIRFLNSTRVL